MRRLRAVIIKRGGMGGSRLPLGAERPSQARPAPPACDSGRVRTGHAGCRRQRPLQAERKPAAVAARPCCTAPCHTRDRGTTAQISSNTHVQNKTREKVRMVPRHGKARGPRGRHAAQSAAANLKKYIMLRAGTTRHAPLD